MSGYDFFDAYDGHGRGRVAQLCQEHMHVLLVEEVLIEGWSCVEGRWREIITESFSRLNGEVEATTLGESERTLGSTAVVAMVGTKLIVVANYDDSRAMLSRDNAALPSPLTTK
ncbi:hypothetical protein ZIOFF_051285 [Zingiber officinale]|uniref:protein-serine/threonine phosphatase n=1 Tax=Zingiber officinale TaxID=94328 RepID=A0A8J5FLN7_ZINOF|nr:hypothetical protein ZIOFF_051285 [Zingiber officinale]